jgi:hypothetical protein
LLRYIYKFCIIIKIFIFLESDIEKQLSFGTKISVGIGASLSVILSIASSNPLSMIYSFDSAATINHLQYVNQQNPIGMDGISNIMKYGHISSIFDQPRQWDDRTPSY